MDSTFNLRYIWLDGGVYHKSAPQPLNNTSQAIDEIGAACIACQGKKINFVKVGTACLTADKPERIYSS
ncbi:MAG: hypothetical protein EHM93_06285 [Bacteroidales bacterium]|nr:MAG: hypothetical protein EHM93_06285 [Bacteroidales bacterium]